MASKEQIQANRRNSLKSTGPKTPEGKASARLNATKHGLLSKKMATQISNPHIDELYETACKHGALGGKITDAGGGGYTFFYCDFRRKHIVAEQLEQLGAQVVEFDFDFGGLQTWEVR